MKKTLLGFINIVIKVGNFKQIIKKLSKLVEKC